jgi:FtsH-binding integral membrane protein
MSDLDARLAAALEADAPPERDALFRLDVLARIERARFRRRIVSASVIALIAAMLVAVNAQTIDTWIAADARLGWVLGAAALVAMLALPGMPTAATPGVRTVVKVLGRWFSGS